MNGTIMNLPLTQTAVSNLKRHSMHMSESYCDNDVATELSLYRSIVEVQSDLICRYDLEGRITFANRAFCQHFQQSSQDLLGSSFLALVFEAERDEILPHLQSLTLENPQVVKDWRMIMPDSMITWHAWTERALFDDHGQVVGYQAVGRDITDRKEAEEQIRYHQFHDPLTGSYNRSFLTVEMKRLDVIRQLPISIIVGNINGLKLINDSFGYTVGDRLLVTTARLLKSCCREEDIIARCGGDQFVLLLCNTAEATASAICDRIKRACLESNHDPIQPSLALGAATKEHTKKDINQIFREAEDIMLRNKLLESRSIRNSIISSLEITLHEKTTETREHAERLRGLCLEFGQALGLASEALDRLALLAKLHDIGKIGIPDEILCKPGPLTRPEWEVIKKHPEIGYRITRSSRDLAVLSDEILAHHERWDGGGYPSGLGGERIPFLARILAIIDAFDVMTHDRVYKSAISHGDALDEIIRCSGSQFDPALVDVFAQMLN